jgi:hypothetical protein
MDTVRALCHSYPKNQSEVNASTDDLDTKILRTGRVLGTRWVASVFRTMKAFLWCSCAALYRHFTSASEDCARVSEERADFLGLFGTFHPCRSLRIWESCTMHCKNWLCFHSSCKIGTFPLWKLTEVSVCSCICLKAWWTNVVNMQHKQQKQNQKLRA